MSASISTVSLSDALAGAQESKASGNLTKLRTLSKTETAEKIDALSKEFEAQFVSQMLGTMFATVDVKESLGGSDEEQQFQSLLIDEYGKAIVRSGGLGLADRVKHEMLRQQEIGAN